MCHRLYASFLKVRNRDRWHSVTTSSCAPLLKPLHIFKLSIAIRIFFSQLFLKLLIANRSRWGHKPTFRHRSNAPNLPLSARLGISGFCLPHMDYSMEPLCGILPILLIDRARIWARKLPADFTSILRGDGCAASRWSNRVEAFHFWSRAESRGSCNLSGVSRTWK